MIALGQGLINTFFNLNISLLQINFLIFYTGVNIQINIYICKKNEKNNL